MSLSFGSGACNYKEALIGARQLLCQCRYWSDVHHLLWRKIKPPFLPRSSLLLWAFIQQQHRSPAVMSGQSGGKKNKTHGAESVKTNCYTLIATQKYYWCSFKMSRLLKWYSCVLGEIFLEQDLILKGSNVFVSSKHIEEKRWWKTDEEESLIMISSCFLFFFISGVTLFTWIGFTPTLNVISVVTLVR